MRVTSTAEKLAAGPSAVRANAYHCLAQAFSNPREWDPTFPERLRKSLTSRSQQLSPLVDRAAGAIEAALDDREALLVAYAKLFVGPFEIAAAPWASYYLDPEHRLMGQVSAHVADAYSEAGVGPSTLVREAPDHVTHELEFMYFLAFQEATTGDSSWAARQTRFWNQHLGQWLPQLAAAMEQAHLHPAYDRIAELISAFAKLETDAFA